ncbi:hypothetical protein PENTCL1PPCAC_23421 [Pristionchus entomophagus]|uniref:Cleavage/polyadenylation specificity factor A subunit N-terminal domain-containing protein n=1 Tax=Pristionchus entomophagus TaxID=358040 RepID=A0AAV5U416_9BILA|nr:hypothetical protein PENTCL1PPCAC_23421 [Pristionchus entomophagus]
MRSFPLSIAASSDYTALIAVDNTIFLLKREGDQWACRKSKGNKYSKLAMVIPGMEVAVVGGRHNTHFVSTSFLQASVHKDQLRVLSERPENFITCALTSITRDGITYVYVIGERELALWRIENQSIISERTFLHNSENIEKSNVGSHISGTGKSVARKQLKLSRPDLIHDFPISAMVLKTNENLKNGISSQELLVISYESGVVKLIETADIIKNPWGVYMPIGDKKINIDNLYPCWEFPFVNSEYPSRLIGLRDGIPIVFKLKNGEWEVAEIVQPRKASYSYVNSKASHSGQTVSVFYNRNDICFCLFDKEFQWREDRLKCEIKNCFISATIVVIQTDSKILFVDVLGLLNEEDNANFNNTSLLLESLDSENGSSKSMKEIQSILVIRENANVMISCILLNGVLHNIVLSKSPISRETSLQDLYDRPFTGNVTRNSSNHLVGTTEFKHRVIDMTGDDRGNVFHLIDNGTIIMHRTTNDKLISSVRTDLFTFVPSTAKLIGFITLEADDNGRRIYVMARDREQGDHIYLKEAATMEDMVFEPIPYNFGDKPVFGHFVGPSDHGRCALYTTSTRKIGDVPELIRIEARLPHAHYMESLVLSDSLFQPDTIVRLVHHKDSSSMPIVSIVSSYGNVVELHQLRAKGRLLLKKKIELRTGKDKPIFVTSFDVYYLHSINTLYIMAGSSTGELSWITWNSCTNEHLMGVSSGAESSIFEIYFFGKEHETDPPRLIAYLTDTVAKCFC